MRTIVKLVTISALVIFVLNFAVAKDECTAATLSQEQTTQEVGIEDFIYSTFLGGNNYDMGIDVTVDSQGNIIVTGSTKSENFPMLNGIQESHAGGEFDAFIAKFNVIGQLLWSTYLGGNDWDFGQCIIVDDSDNIILLGMTESCDFPITEDACQKSYKGEGDCFIAKFATNGSMLYSSFFGGIGYDVPLNAEFDSSGNIVFIGGTSSEDFPVTATAPQSALGGKEDNFVTILAPDFSSLLYSTFQGGSGADFGQELSIDIEGNVIVLGVTNSSDFPVTNNAYKATVGGPGDVFFAKYNPFGQLTYASYFGGADGEWGFAVDTDSSGNIILAGKTNSTDLPTTVTFQPNFGELWDGFITKFAPNGQDLIFSTFLGGDGVDEAYNLDVCENDNILITGATDSDNFPVFFPFQDTRKGGLDIFITLLNQNGLPLFSSYMGGNNYEIPHNQLYTNNTLYMIGATASLNFLLSSDAYQSHLRGLIDTYVFRFDISAYLIAVRATMPIPGFELFPVICVLFSLLTIRLRKTRKKHL
ncbi:MAG: SBBP repeat-containing protein [Promethearchaeota archaeon]